MNITEILSGGLGIAVLVFFSLVALMWLILPLFLFVRLGRIIALLEIIAGTKPERGSIDPDIAAHLARKRERGV